MVEPYYIINLDFFNFSYQINETHVVLQIQKDFWLINRHSIGQKIEEFLFLHDIYIYVFEKMLIYNELDGNFNYFILVLVIAYP